MRPLRLLPVVGLALSFASAAPAAAAPGDTGQFNTPCGFSHRAPDDPIVFPGRAGASHSHDFLGNVSTNASSTLESLKAAGTHCFRREDRSAYWVPTLLVDGYRVAPRSSNVYYRTAGRDPASIRPFPQGLKLIAGDSHSRGPQDRRIAEWRCETGPPFHERLGPPRDVAARERRALRRHRRAARRLRRAIRRAKSVGDAAAVGRHRAALRRHRRAIRRERRELRRLRNEGTSLQCPPGQTLKATVRFPDCWDGAQIDSADHKSHLAYSSWSREAQRRICPASHPVAVPKLNLNLRYATAGGRDARLSSGSIHTMHADFFNAWDEATLAGLVQRCLNADVHCGRR
jgi:hypothetical protein